MARESVRKKGKIVNLLLALMLLVGLIPLIICGKILIDYNSEILATNQRQSHSQICQSVANSIAQYLNSCFSIIEPVCKYLELGYDPTQPSLVFLDTKTQSLISDIYNFPNSKIRKIRITNLEGPLLEVGPDAPPDSVVEPEMNRAFQECIGNESRFTYVSRPLITTEFVQDKERGGDAVMVVGRKVTYNNRACGAMVVVFSLADIFSMINSNPAGNTVFLLDGNGTVILHPDQGMVKKKANLSSSRVFQEMQNLRGRAISTLTYTDASRGEPVEMLASVFMVQDSNVSWGVVVQIPEALAHLEIKNMVMTTIIWILLSIVAALLLSYFFSLRISIPIQMLTMRTLSIKEGRFSERVDIKSNNEIGILADNFNTMAENIERYIQQLKQAAEENRELFFGAIRTLAAAIDAKDPYTKGHSDRVMRFSELVAREMRLGGEEVEQLKIAALLHDVGKIGITDSILQKPGMLTEEEFQVMKRHPQLGADIMKQIPKLAEIIPGMRFHHESLDGSGYPMGLRGEQIPLAARIICVADTFDAMTTDRPYQKGFSMSEALARIRNMAGKKFDFHVVQALTAVYEKRAQEFESINRASWLTDVTFH